MRGQHEGLRWRWVAIGGGALLVASGACGGETVVFGTAGTGVGGATGAGAAGPTTTTGVGGMSTSSVGGSPGACTDDDDCLAFDQTCAAYGCDDGQCTVTSTSPEGTPCGEGLICDGQGACVEADLLGLGSPCGAAAECLSGQCIDGVCCDAACDGTCEACDVDGAVGTCTPQEAGSDPDLECMGGTCDGAGSCATGEVEWSKTYGDGFEQLGHSVAADSMGNVVVAGYHFGTINFGNGPLVSSGGRDVFVAKLDPMGNAVWALEAGDFQSQWAWDVAVDVGDNVVVTGYHYGSLDLGGGVLTSSSQRDPFLAKYDAAGNHVWSQSFDGQGEDLARATATGPGGVVAMTGYFLGDLNLGGQTLTSAGDLDIFVAVYDAMGNHVWSDAFGDGDEDRAFDVAFDSQGNLILTGRFSGSIDFGNGSLTSAGSTDAFVAKFDATGTVQWAGKYGDASAQYIRGVDVDANDDVWIAGYGAGSFSVAGGPALTSVDGWDVFVAKLDGSNGNHVQSQMFPGTDDQITRDLVVDASGNVLVGGHYEDDPDFGGGPLSNGGFLDAFLVKLAPSGTLLWSHGFGGPNSQIGHGVAVDPMGNAFLAGYFQTSIDFGLGALASAGQEDVYVTKLAP